MQQKNAARNRSPRECSSGLDELIVRMPKKTPGWVSEGIREPRRSERPISRMRISRGVCRCPAWRIQRRNHSAARMRPHRDGSAKTWTGWRCGRQVSWEISAELRVDSMQHSCDGGARYTDKFSFANIFFTFAYATDEQSCRMRRRRVVHTLRYVWLTSSLSVLKFFVKKQGDRSRPA